MASLTPEQRAQRAQLRGVFATRLADRVERLEGAWACLSENPGDPALVRALYVQVHNLAGAGASFEFPEISELAHAIQWRLKPSGSDAPLAPEPLEPLRAALQGLLALLESVHAEWGSDGGQPAALPAQAAGTAASGRPVVHLVEDDPQLAWVIAWQLGQHGYSVEVVPDPSGLEAAVAACEPAAIIVDVTSGEGEMAAERAVRTVNADRDPLLPVIFTSMRNDLSARLSVLRAGGAAFFAKPLDFGVLTRQLAEATLSLDPGDLLVLFSDGLSEAADAAGEQLEIEGIEAAFTAAAGQSVPAQLDAVVDRALQLREGLSLEDDLTLLGACRLLE